MLTRAAYLADMVCRSLMLWNVERTGATSSFATLNHVGAVYGLAYIQDRGILAAATVGQVNLWQLVRGGAVAAGTLKSHTGPVLALNYMRSLGLLASAGVDKSINIWSDFTPKSNSSKMLSPTLLSTHRNHTDVVSSLVFLPDKQLLASGSWYVHACMHAHAL